MKLQKKLVQLDCNWCYRRSAYTTNTHNLSGAVIPIAIQESRALLDSALSQEASSRLTNELLPSQLEEKARRVLAEVKRRPGWLKWTRNMGGYDL